MRPVGEFSDFYGKIVSIRFPKQISVHMFTNYKFLFFPKPNSFPFKIFTEIRR